MIEFAGLAPGPFCGKILKDMGARVIRIDKVIIDLYLLALIVRLLLNLTKFLYLKHFYGFLKNL